MHCESVCVLGDAAGVLMSKQISISLSTSVGQSVVCVPVCVSRAFVCICYRRGRLLTHDVHWALHIECAVGLHLSETNSSFAPRVCICAALKGRLLRRGRRTCQARGTLRRDPRRLETRRHVGWGGDGMHHPARELRAPSLICVVALRYTHRSGLREASLARSHAPFFVCAANTCES